MDMTALLFSTALAVVASVQDAAPQPDAAAPQPVPETTEPVSDPLSEPVDVAPAPVVITLEAGARRAQDWLSDLDTLRARFEQIAADASVSTGVLEIDRPGRARFDYDDPSPVLVVADGATVAIADFDLETLDRVPIGATPLRFLLNETLDLVESGAAVDAGHYDGRLYVTLEDPNAEVEGRLTLVFDDPDPQASADTMTLAGWFAIDALGGLTEVRLSEVETGLRLSPRQFILDDEDVTGGDRRRRRG